MRVLPRYVTYKMQLNQSHGYSSILCQGDIFSVYIYIYIQRYIVDIYRGTCMLLLVHATICTMLIDSMHVSDE